MNSKVAEVEVAPNAPSEATLRLSARQSLMWLDEQLYPSGRYHNSVLTVAPDGPLDVAHMARAWEQTVADRDALRMVVDTKEGRQWCLENVRVSLPEVTLDSPDQVASWIADRSVRLLGAEGFRWDAALLRLAPHRHIFYLCQHHLITDGISMMLLVDHLAERYAGRAPTGCSSFQEYLRFEAQYRNSPKAERDRAYWNRLSPGASSSTP